MEKTFQLDQSEQQMVSGMENDNLRLNARYGQLSREIKDIETRLLASEEQQRSFIRQALANRGVQRFEAAQIVQGGQLVARLPDEPMQPPAVMPAPAPMSAGMDKVPDKVNGPSAKSRHAQSE
jgi:hypothetical protein